ncbi:MAG: DNA mismatch repair protein MutS, partial [Tannerellaceae bacterium]|nr:DNA mismatch repair protein MutS [Tannerellaceae bacterium]
MEQIYEYYRNNIEAYTRRVNNLTKKIHLIGTIRLLLVAGMIADIWLLKSLDWEIIAGSICLFLIPIILLMIYHSCLAHRRDYAEMLINLGKNELKGLDYDYSAFDGAADQINGEHSFSLDLDLFGERSLFQAINRTVTFGGRELLVDWFRNPLHTQGAILQRQEAIAELSALTRLRQHFYVCGKLNPGEKDDTLAASSLTKPSFYFINSSFWKIMVWFIPIVWILFLS